MKNLLWSLCLLVVFSSCQKEINGVSDAKAQNFTDISYGSDPAQKMDIYLPAGRTDTTRLIIMVHGGAWIEGDKSDFTQFVSVLQQRLPGYAIANINYRLASQLANHFPTQENDMKAAVDFLISKSAEYQISQKFVLLGASAGAHMALLQAYKYNSPKIKAVAAFFGPTDIAQLYDQADPQLQLAMQILMAGTPSSNATLYTQSSPLSFVNAQSPPSILLHGDMDDIVPIDQSIALDAKLQTAGVVHQLITYPGLGHDIWPADKMNDAFDHIEAFIKANVH